MYQSISEKVMVTMKKSYKGFLLIVFLVFTVACSNDEQENTTKNFIRDNDYNVIYSDLKGLINEISMFPTRNSEEKFIYYVEGIKDNCHKFTNDEINSFSNLLSFNYQFNFNKIDYDINDFNKDVLVIKNCKK